VTEFADDRARFQVFETNGGRHEHMSTRFDFNPEAQVWSFVSSYSRADDGTLTFTNPTWMGGTY
jgi:hypothetical protein